MKNVTDILNLINKAKSKGEAKKILENWGKEIVDECGLTAEMWKSVTPNFTSSYINTVKKLIY